MESWPSTDLQYGASTVWADPAKQENNLQNLKNFYFMFIFLLVTGSSGMPFQGAKYVSSSSQGDDDPHDMTRRVTGL